MDQAAERRRNEQNQINGIILGQIQSLALLIREQPPASAPKVPEFNNIVCDSMNINPVVTPKLPDFDLSQIKTKISKTHRAKRQSKKDTLKVNNFTTSFTPEEEVSMALQSLPMLKLREQKSHEQHSHEPSRGVSPRKRKRKK